MNLVKSVRDFREQCFRVKLAVFLDAMSSSWIPQVPQDVDHLPDRIAASVEGKNILMTGASGFIGNFLFVFCFSISKKVLHTFERN